ncbi:MAG TPA: sugar-binding protein [Candidatus Hydrogenedentes bacterium]|nr:sugar-binding protein [Candidatus Hydrogenedentota bacterium]HQM48087.1 sugar-binding protein [Candidatus Hydrogenedentota bacterium]
MKTTAGLLVLATILVLSLPAWAKPNEVPLPLGKKLIEYGWDVPTAEQVRKNIDKMEKRPFDGVIFRLDGGGNVLVPEPWTEERFKKDYENAERIKWERFTDNFVIMWAASNQDWFNDNQWTVIINNVQLVARAARLARCAGICFDAEPYGDNPWDYGKTAHRDTRSFEEYQAKVRQRGAQFIRAVETELPDPQILTFFLLSYFADLCLPMDPAFRQEKLSKEHYALLPAFLEGMLEGSQPGTRIVDGNEGAYYYKDWQQYFEKYHQMTQRGLYLIPDELQALYREKVLVGQALYVDQYFGLREQKVLGHFLTPEQRPLWFEHNVYWALYTSDKYVWCYSERMNWWEDGNVPQGCEEAILSARRKLANGQNLDIDLVPIIETAQKREQDAITGDLAIRTAEIKAIENGVSRPKIDGNLEDEVWLKTEPLDPFVPMKAAQETVSAQTQTKVTYDNEYLYIAFRCEEPKAAELQVVGENRDDYVFTGDVVEVFIKPSEQSASFYHFAINPANVVWEGLHIDVLQTEFSPVWEHAAQRGADFWSVEIALPWKAINMETPKTGSQVKVNLCRERYTEREWTLWSQTVYHFLEPEHFGTFIFK